VAHRILFTKRADRDYADVPKGPIRELDKILDGLRGDPFPAGCRKLRGYGELWRVRFGSSWRVVYHVDARAAEVTIARIFPRALGYERALRGLK
jgi:mRNA-degrading endonuclease RelE of RelBE toxin-antitoxin system